MPVPLRIAKQPVRASSLEEMMEANPYIDALGKAIGTELSLSASGSVGLSLGGRNLLIRWVEATRSFVLYAEVGALNGWRSGEVCRHLLIANFLPLETQGATLSHNDATGMVGLNIPCRSTVLRPTRLCGPGQHRDAFRGMENPSRRLEQGTGRSRRAGAGGHPPRRRGSG